MPFHENGPVRYSVAMEPVMLVVRSFHRAHEPA